MFKHRTTIVAAAAAAATLAVLAGPSAGSSSMPITTCGQTVITNAVLTKDLDCAGISGIVVGAARITIDLKGHVLKGDRLAGHFGVSDDSYDDVTIENGVVRNFYVGVEAFNGTDDLTLSNVVASGNTIHGFDIEGVGASVVSSSAAGNGKLGIVVSGASASVTRTTVAGNGSDGMWLYGDALSVRASKAVGNAVAGIRLNGDSARVTSTSANGNGFFGLYVTGDLASITSTAASGNGNIGIFLEGDAPLLKGNRAEGNGFAGGVSDGLGTGINAAGFTTAPVGTNVARGNDQVSGQCYPSSLCPVVGSKVKGTPISSCGQTVTVNAYLTNDLVCPGNSGMIVGASGITIDLNGHVLRGDGINGHFGIADIGGYDKVTVKNGVLRNFYSGVEAGNLADSLTVSNIVASGNTRFGIEVLGASAKVVSSTAAGNGSNGIALVGDLASIRSSTTAGNIGDGLWANGAVLSIKSSTAAGNGVSGFEVTGDSASVTSSTTAGNVGLGLSVAGAEPSIKSSTASGNAVAGILLDGDAPKLTGNRADGNGFAGGISDGIGPGIIVKNFTTAPTGTNLSRGNDDSSECVPAALC